MTNIDKMTDNEIISKYEAIKEEIKIKTEQLKMYKQKVYDIVWNSDDEQLETNNSIFKIQYKPKWKYTDELTKQEQDYKKEIKLQKKEEEYSGLASKTSAGGYLIMKPRIKRAYIQ